MDDAGRMRADQVRGGSGEGPEGSINEFPDDFPYGISSADASFDWEALGDVDDFYSLTDIYDTFGVACTR